jgi:cytochrome c-type biogenesis protein CcmF
MPEFGFGVLCAVLVAAAYTFAVAMAAGAGRSRWLASARLGAYGTIALVALAVLVLAYAFVTHDFRVRYVVGYSDRSMSTIMLLAALWGGQDGSLLWWLFLTCAFAGIGIWVMRGRHRQLQPYTIAALMVVLVFLAIVMLFAVNPFATLASGAPPDGRGLNYQLRNFYMIVHPPSLYVGFTSTAVPFALAVAALITGKLDDAWVFATRKWMVFAWLFLTIGNGLGMIWAYEELGWGGYWNWDPVENASLLPWLIATPYLHSIIVQERRGMLKVWNVALICTTFLLTLWGTFLTRSGLISSVHAFAKSGIGTFFLVFMAILAVGCVALVAYRWPLLRSEARLESLLSREAAFILNNIVFTAVTAFIFVATIWPRISEWLFDEEGNIGPAFYDACVPPLALIILALMGMAPLLGWRKTSPALLARSFRAPLAVAAIAAVAHLTLGWRFGYPAFVQVEPALSGFVGKALAWLSGKLPWVTFILVAFNVAVIVQELVRGVAARRRATDEPPGTALIQLILRARRRYGGYLIHFGIAVMFLGFAGRAYNTSAEATLEPGQSMRIGAYELRYAGHRSTADAEKRMYFADLEVTRQGRPVGRLSPAKYVYRASPNQPSTEVDRLVRPTHDLYAIVGMLNRRAGTAGFKVHVNPLVSLVWAGLTIACLGALVPMWPDRRRRRSRAFGYLQLGPPPTAGRQRGGSDEPAPEAAP